MESAYIHTPIGIARLDGDGKGLASVTILDGDVPTTHVVPEVLADAVRQLQEYFNGQRKTFRLTLNPKGTDFQKRVWTELLEIPYGKTISYLELSKKLGNTKAVRAVAAANGKNPLSILVPCHRVIGSDGSLTGYAGGLHRKKWLLDHESPAKQQSLF